MKVSRRKKNKRQREYLHKFKEVIPYRPCPICGGRGPHFIPPSFGDPGFFICTKKSGESNVP